jgi:hypothetical protein
VNITNKIIEQEQNDYKKNNHDTNEEFIIFKPKTLGNKKNQPSLRTRNKYSKENEQQPSSKINLECNNLPDKKEPKRHDNKSKGQIFSQVNKNKKKEKKYSFFEYK